MKTKAAVLERVHGPFVVTELDLADPGPGEVRVKMAACGVCHSDYHLLTGATRHPLPVVAGHEGAGIIDQVGPGVDTWRVGDRVILSWAPDCGRCFYCLRGKPNLCSTYESRLWQGVLLDGTPRLSRHGAPVYHYCGLAAFAEYAVVPEAACVALTQPIPLTAAATIGCAVATGVGAAWYSSPVSPGEDVAVLGCGGVGINIVQAAAAAGAGRIVAIDPLPSRRASALAFGATTAFAPEGDWIRRVRAGAGGRGVDRAFEAAGIPELQEAGFEILRPGGTLALVGLSPMGSTTNLSGAVITRQEKSIVGSYYGSVWPRRDFPRLVDLYTAGRLRLDELVTRTFTLDEINEAFAAMLAGEVLRGVIVFDAA